MEKSPIDELKEKNLLIEKAFFKTPDNFKLYYHGLAEYENLENVIEYLKEVENVETVDEFKKEILPLLAGFDSLDDYRKHKNRVKLKRKLHKPITKKELAKDMYLMFKPEKFKSPYYYENYINEMLKYEHFDEWYDSLEKEYRIRTTGDYIIKYLPHILGFKSHEDFIKKLGADEHNKMIKGEKIKKVPISARKSINEAASKTEDPESIFINNEFIEEITGFKIRKGETIRERWGYFVE